VQDEAKAALAKITETAMEGSAVVLTVNGHKQLMTLDEFATMPIVEFAKLFTASLHYFALGWVCLLCICICCDCHAVQDHLLTPSSIACQPLH